MTSFALIGASGNIGGRILDEALSRGHRVTGTTRDTAKLPPRTNLTPRVVNTADDLDWTAISPPASIQPGQRTGRFRLGLDHLLEDAKGVSHISREDFAIAIVDGIETPKHVRRRFTAAY